MNWPTELWGAVALLALSALAACGAQDEPAEIRQFCATLAEVNRGEVDTSQLPELAGHSEVVGTLLEVAPPTIERDVQRIHRAVDAWARSISGDHSMLDTFDLLTAPELVRSEGRLADYIAVHCGLDLGGAPWSEGPVPEEQGSCPAWPRVGTPLTFNHFPNLPDIAGSNYFGQNFLVSRWLAALGVERFRGAFVVAPGDRVEISGQFPRARYFAFHPNDMDLNNLPTLRDKDIEPEAGSRNPFREVVTRGDHHYRVALEFTAAPADPAPNTRYVGLRKNGQRPNRFVINMLRMYHVDAGNVAGSGGVPLPAVTRYSADGEQRWHYPACDLFAPGRAPLVTGRVFPALPVADHRPRNPPRWTTSSNFDAPSDTMANADAQYLATHYSERFGDLFVVRGRYLTAPDTRRGESPATPGRQVRLYNLCTYNFWNGAAVHCLLDNQLAVDGDGYYTLVVSREGDRPDNLDEYSATWLDWGPYLDGQLQYRFVYRDNLLVQAIAAGAEGRAIAPELSDYLPRAVPCNRAAFEAGGWQACWRAVGTIADTPDHQLLH